MQAGPQCVGGGICGPVWQARRFSPSLSSIPGHQLVNNNLPQAGGLKIGELNSQRNVNVAESGWFGHQPEYPWKG